MSNPTPLTDAYDDLADALRRAQDHLLELKVPNDVWVSYAHGEYTTAGDGLTARVPAQFVVGLGRHAARRCLLHGVRLPGGEVVDLRPPENLSVEQRLAVANAIPALHDALVTARNTLVPRLTEAVRTLNRFLDAQGAAPLNNHRLEEVARKMNQPK